MELQAVRQATPDDVPALFGLRVAAERWLQARGVDQWRSGEVVLGDVERQVRAGEWHVLATVDGLGGGLRLLWSDEEIWQHEDCFAAYVHGLVIDRRYAGRGVGAGLLAWAAQRARDAGAPLLRLDCGESNPGLRAYYARLGFREVGRRDAEGRPWLSAVLLEKDL